MTRPHGFDELPPTVQSPDYVRSGAGTPITITITITNRASEPRIIAVTMLGVDSAWLPGPSRSRPIMPGEAIAAALTLRPSEGTMPARYPLAIAVQALDPVSQQATSPTSVSQIDLVVDAPGQITVTLDPVDTTAVFGKKLTVFLHNSSSVPENVRLEVRAPQSAIVDVGTGTVSVPPGATVGVRSRVNVARPSLFRRKARHAYTITARSGGAPRYAEGSLTSRPMIGPVGTKTGAVLTVLALWVALAIIFIPRLADKVRKNEAAPAKTTTSSAAPSKSGGPGGTGSSDQPNGGGSGGADGGSGGSSGTNGAGAAAAAAPVQLNGTVTGNAPSGVTVSLSSVRLGSDAATGAKLIGATTTDAAEVGKIPSTAGSLAPQNTIANRSVTTGADGAWSFAKVKPVGYYLVIFAKAGYQTQRFVINGAATSANEPIKVALVAGEGSLHGVVHNARGGLIGGATVVINDGTNVITTSSNSTGGAIGSWSVSGLSTPSSYVVSVSRSGLGTQSQLVSLGAGGSAAVNTTLTSGVSTLTGNVGTMHGKQRIPLGGVRISATDGTITRAASTVTTGNQKGTYTLPSLTVGRWSITMQADGYQLQSRTVEIKPGKPTAAVNATLSLATAVVNGVVSHGPAKLIGAGLILSNVANTYKQTTDNDGAFSFDGVAPGVYTLTAQYFGMDTSSQSVTAIVGKQTPPATFDLTQTVIKNTSTVVGYAGNAVSSGGSLGCQKIVNPDPLPPTYVLGCKVSFRLLNSQGDPVLTKLNDSDTPGPLSTQDVSNTGPTPYILSTADGLEPGLYELTISSPGFIPATVNVRVPLNSVAAAPQVNLFPANTIAGQLDTIAGAHINAVGDETATTPGANCVVAVPVGFPTATFDITTFTCADGAVLDPLKAQCEENGTPAPAFGIVQNDGTYRITGLCDGRYSVHVVIGNASFVQPTQFDDETVAHGQTLPYSPHIARKGVMVLNVRQLDPTTGIASPPAGTPTVNVKNCGSAHVDVSDVQLDSDGKARIFGFGAGSVTCTVTMTVGGKDFLGNTGLVQMFNDNDTTVTATLSSGLDPVFGRVITSLGNTTSVTPVGNHQNGVTVHVHAVTSFSGGVAVATDATVTTDDNGCFAVQATTDSSTPIAPAGCGASVGSVLKMDIKSKTVTISVDSGNLTQAAGTQVVTLGSGTATDIAVVARPVSIAGAKFTSNLDANNLPGATVTLTAQHANGSGTVSVGITGSGQLTWLDSNIGTAGLVWPGTYGLTVQTPGFENQSGTLTCGQVLETDSAYPASTCTLNPNLVTARGALTGTVTSTLPMAGGGTQVNGATVIAHPCTAGGTCLTSIPKETSACPAVLAGDVQVTTNSAGQYAFVGIGSRYVLPVGVYNIIVCAPGLRTATVGSYEVKSGENSQNVAMNLLGGLSGTITGSDGTGRLVGATVTLSCVAVTDAVCPGATKTTTTDGSGNYSFVGSVGPYFMDVGTWHLHVTADGFSDGDVDVTIASGSNAPPSDTPKGDVTLQAKGAFTGTVLGTAGVVSTPLSSATVSIDYCGVDGTTCTTPPTDPRAASTTSSGLFSFASNATPYVLTKGKWHIVITAPGYVGYDALIQINNGANNQTFTLDALGALTGTVFGQGASTQQLSGASVKARLCKATDTTTCTSTTTADTTTNSVGGFSFNALTPGTWQLTATAFGYTQAADPPFVVGSGAQSHDLTMNVNRVTERIHVQISGSANATKYAVVTIAPTDNPADSTTLTVDPSTKIYPFANVLPGAYSVTVTGDSSALGGSIVTTIVSINIPLVNVAPFTADVNIPVSVYGAVVTGKVVGPAQVPGAASGVSGVNVVLTTDGSTAALDAADQTMSTSTGAGGTFAIGGVPNGTYTVRINGPASDPNNGYEVLLVSPQVTVAFGQPRDIGTQTLLPVHQQVKLTLTYDTADTDVASASPKTIVPTNSYTWPSMTLPIPTTTTSGTSTIATYTISSVPFGCWKLDDLPLSAAHPVKTPTLHTAVGGGCTSAFGVSKSQTPTESDPAYSLDEHVLTINTTINTNPLDATPAPTITAEVAGSGSPKNVTVAGGATKVYLVPDTYTVTLSSPRSTHVWPMPAASGPINLNGAKSTSFTVTEADFLTLTVDTYTGMVAGDSLTVKLKCTGTPAQDFPTGCGTQSTVGTLAPGAQLAISNLAPGPWDVVVSGTVNGVAVTKHQVVTLTTAGPNKTVMANWS